jgi:hypothetical protein
VLPAISGINLVLWRGAASYPYGKNAGRTHPDDAELHAHLRRDTPAAGHREVPEMRGQLEIAPAGIPGKTVLQQHLQLPAEICADLGLGDTDYRADLIVRARLAHTLESSAVFGDPAREPA